MAQQDLPGKIAQDITDMVPSPIRKAWNYYSGAIDKLKPAQKRGTLPPEWEKANEDSRNKQMAEYRRRVGKVPARTAPKKKSIARKRTVKRKVS